MSEDTAKTNAAETKTNVSITERNGEEVEKEGGREGGRKEGGKAHNSG